ncbi:MAG: hypothetical protein INR71_12455 [Terriglobus roseus]|nr:hypothetical protein [Terriglobus roseus]
MGKAIWRGFGTEAVKGHTVTRSCPFDNQSAERADGRRRRRTFQSLQIINASPPGAH